MHDGSKCRNEIEKIYNFYRNVNEINIRMKSCFL